MARFVIIEGEMKGMVFRLLEDSMIIGRSVSAAIRLNDTEVSRQHSKIVKEGDVFYVEDLGSRNGTVVNGEKIGGRRSLKDGDKIRVGKTVLEFQLAPSVSSDVEAAMETPPMDEKKAKAQTVISAELKSPSVEGKPAEPSKDEIAILERMRNAKESLLEEIRKVIIGQEEVVEQIITALFARGHCLIVGVPGLAKTLMVKTIASVLDLDFKRIQFTPDLMPSDITGTDVLQEDPITKERSFRFIKGPIFANVLLADEINRTPPKTQAALLEAMQEYRVTASGYTYNLPLPFFVLATQNPIEQEGTYPLPEAQLDRFMFMINITYPQRDEEIKIVKETTGEITADITPVLSGEEISVLQNIVRKVPISDYVASYATDIARASRPTLPDSPDFVKNWVAWGAGPRAAQYLVLGAKARAVLNGRFNVSCADVRSVAYPVLRHRVLTNFNADAEGVNSDKIIGMLLEAVPEPAVV
jgi:MoxR-like ATPase